MTYPPRCQGTSSFSSVVNAYPSCMRDAVRQTRVTSQSTTSSRSVVLARPCDDRSESPASRGLPSVFGGPRARRATFRQAVTNSLVTMHGAGH